MMTTTDYEHARIRTLIRRQLEMALPEFDVENDVAFITDLRGERTPDLFVMDPKDHAEFRSGHFLSMRGVKLVLEVTSKDTRKADVTVKPHEYAASGVPVYLIVDRKAHEVVVHHGPTPHGYAHTDRYPVGENLRLPGPIDVDLEMTFLPDYLD